MNIEDSTQRIDQVIAEAAMPRRDHDTVKNDLAFLMARAKLADGPKDNTTYKVKVVCENCGHAQKLCAKKGEPRPHEWTCENCRCKTDGGYGATPIEEAN